MRVKMPEAEGDRESERKTERERERERERDSPVICGESKPPCNFAPSIFLLLWHKLLLENVFLPFICRDNW